jgi:hypothetical protein
MKKYKRTVRGETKYVIDVMHHGKRRRKSFSSFSESLLFEKNNLNEWLAKFEDQPDGYNTTVSVGIKKYLENYQSRYPKARWDKIESRLSYLLKWGLGAQKIDSIDVQYIQRRVEEQSSWKTASTKYTYKNQFVIFLNWCGLLGYCRKTKWEIKTLRMPPREREIGILTPKQVERLLNEDGGERNNSRSWEKYRPSLAIMFFAGLRPQGEMEKLDYSDIKHGESISVPASKTPSRFITGLPDNLWSWIPDKKSGPVMPSWKGMNQSRSRAVKRLGFKYPGDGARHSFGSYGYWMYGLEWTMHTMGHMNYDTFKTYYMNKKVSKAEAEKYFNI